MVLAVRFEVLLALWADPEWRRRFDKCNSTAEMQEVVVAFGKAKGLKIKELAN